MYKSTSTCEGFWLDDKPLGDMTIKYPNGDIYKGEWSFESEKRHGFGTIKKMISGEIKRAYWE